MHVQHERFAYVLHLRARPTSSLLFYYFFFTSVHFSAVLASTTASNFQMQFTSSVFFCSNIDTSKNQTKRKKNVFILGQPVKLTDDVKEKKREEKSQETIKL